MKKLLIFMVSLILISATLTDSLFNIVTKKEDALVNKKFTKFVIVDDATQMVLSKSPIKYDPAKEMPVHYFTLDLPEGIPNTERVFVIHLLENPTSADEYDWVLDDNKGENKIIYSRSKFVIQKSQMNWRFVIRAERILIKSLTTGGFLKINSDGSFSTSKDEANASKWKLIHVY